jgi:hypothetical protein
MSIRGNRRRRAREREARKAWARVWASGRANRVQDTLPACGCSTEAELRSVFDLIRRPTGALANNVWFPGFEIIDGKIANVTDPEMLERVQDAARRMEAESRFVPMYDARDITWTPLPTREPADIPNEIVFRAELGE